MFFKTAKVQVLAFNQEIDKPFTKSASVSKVASFYESNPITSGDIKAKLEKVADIYKISSDPKDYIYVAVRALTADVPNENYDCFAEKELLRFDTRHGCQVYQTFNFKPHHVNHRSADSTQARGVILDSYYNIKNAEHFPEILVAVDRTKDKRLAEGIASGELNGFSMGCSADFTICSICNHKASSPSEFCNHIRFHKGKEFDGKVAFESCEGVVFEEESSVDDPADKNALIQDVILASKKADMEKETEMLIVNKKLNAITDTLNVLTTNLTNGGEKIMANTNSDNELKKVVSTDKNAQDDSVSDIPVESKVEKGKEEKAPGDKKKEDKADKDLKEFKEKKEEIKFKDKTKEEYGIDAKKEGEKGVVNPYAKLFAERRKRKAVDKGTKEYFDKYPAGFGKDYTKEIKKKKIGGKYTKIYSDVRIIPVSRISNKTATTSRYYLVINKETPLYLVSSSNIKFDKRSTAVPEATAISLAIANSIGDIGLVKTMNEYKATRLQSLYAPLGKPSLVTNSNDDLRDDKLRKKPTEGPESDGIDDIAGKGRDLREKNVSDDGEKDMKMATRKRVSELKGLVEMIDSASREGKSDEEVLKIIDAYLKGTTASKKGAGVTDRSIRDFQKVDKFQAEQDKDALVDGIHDLNKVKRDKVKADEVFAGGKDDMKLKRDNVVDLKAEKKDPTDKKGGNPYTKLFVMRRKKAQEVEHSTTKKEHGENVGDQKDWKDTAPSKWEEGQKEVLKESKAKREAKDIAAIDKKLFIERYSRALKVAAKRACLNLIDNELKTHMADVLTTETDSYWGMDEDLAVQLIEESFNRGGGSYIASLIKEAESLFDMPEESFLMIEADVKNLNPVMAVVGSINESAFNEDEVINPLIERASKNNPIFVPKADSVGKYEHLKGILRGRLI